MSTSREGHAPCVTLRRERWDDACRRHGLATDDARAAAIGVSGSQVQRVQTNACTPGINFIARACAYFHCPIDALFEVTR